MRSCGPPAPIMRASAHRRAVERHTEKNAIGIQGRTNREIERRSHVAQVFPSVASPEGLAGAVMRDQDEAWSDARHFSRPKMDELHDEPRATGAEATVTEEQAEGFRLVAGRAIDASLELADELEAA